MSDKSTARPWEAIVEPYSDGQTWAVASPMRLLASINNGGKNAEANARLIVRAVNSFDCLRDTLRWFVENAINIREHPELYSGMDHHIREARAALALADREDA